MLIHKFFIFIGLHCIKLEKMINNISAADLILVDPHCTVYEPTNKATRRFKWLKKNKKK